MKTTVKQLAALIFTALLIVAVNAKTEATETVNGSLKVMETELKVENWMTDDSLWNTDSPAMVNINQETETKMILENWMTSESTWDTNFWLNLEPETELEVEDWMTNDEAWNASEMNREAALQLEEWMISNKNWQ